jgi:hypothetical protein
VGEKIKFSPQNRRYLWKNAIPRRFKAVSNGSKRVFLYKK